MGCEYRFTTYEEIERELIRVIKRDGRIEPFDRRKLVGGILKACEKRPISLEVVEKAVEEIEMELGVEGNREIPSNVVGAKVMEKLQAIDQVAYVRYASVYRQFHDIGEFIDEIQNMGRRLRAGPKHPELFK